MHFIVIPGAIYTLNTPELFLTILLALVMGYLTKLLFDKYYVKSGLSETEELQVKLEALQNKFSSEILRKDETELMLQDELKAADKRHIELQVQYAKALTHIEQMRQGSIIEGDEVDTESGHQILENLQDKIARQERSLLELEQQLHTIEHEKSSVKEAYEQLRENNSSKQLLIEQIHKDKKEFEQKLQDQLADVEKIKEQFAVELAEKRLQVKQLQQQLLLGNTTEREQALESEIQRLTLQLQAIDTNRDIDEDILAQKAGITATRIHATQVAEKVEEFRDHLTSILRDTYSYEQLLASNERLNENITRLHTEKRMAEEEIVVLQQIAKDKQKLEEEFEIINASLEQKEASWNETTFSLESSLIQLNSEVQQKEQTIAEFVREKEELSLQIEMLQHKLDEREQLSKEMILAMKDIETRFAHFNHATVEATIVNGNGEMQFR